MASNRTRVLMFAEAVTLAHVARPVALARQLDPSRYEVSIACDDRAAKFLDSDRYRHLSLSSMASEAFIRRLARGVPVYDPATLRGYVDADLALIQSWKPDLIVGDFRLSLSVSARLSGIPYACITNGYWSPAYRKAFPMPALPVLGALPSAIGTALFAMARPFAFALHCRPLNQVRMHFGLPSLGPNLRRVYTDADHVLCADAYDLLGDGTTPSDHSHLGPLPWSPPVAAPDWWGSVPRDKPIIYVTLGSSGPPALLSVVLEALATLPVSVMASTAGAPSPRNAPANAFVAAYLDGDRAAARSRMVICNGGSPTTQQALAAGVPVLGLASNIDQLLNMRSLKDRGAGEWLRTDRATVPAIRRLVQLLLESTPHRAMASTLAATMRSATPAGIVFDRMAGALLSRSDATETRVPAA